MHGSALEPMHETCRFKGWHCGRCGDLAQKLRNLVDHWRAIKHMSRSVSTVFYWHIPCVGGITTIK
jgi:lipid-A-disaccharide synthase-like uncharacterized protein